jgi:hypothetical protein
MIHKLYNGTIQLDFDSRRHRYTLDGTVVDGVTSILKTINKPRLIDWSVRMDGDGLRELAQVLQSHDRETVLKDIERILDRATGTTQTIKVDSATRGTTVHSYVENFIKGTQQELPEDPAIRQRVEKFVRWAKDNVLEFRDSERVVYSKKYGYCGTLDFTCFLKDGGGIYIGDIKTGKYVYPEHLLQTAAYQMAYQEETRTNVAGRIIVRLGENGGEVTITNDQKKDKAAWRGLLSLYKRLSQLKS